MKNVLLLIFLSITLQNYSQTNKQNEFQINKNTVYFEVGGLSMKPFSINYDRVLFSHKNFYYSSSLGIGFFNKKTDTQHYSIPISFNVSTGLHKKNHLEIGLGITYSSKEKENFNEKIIFGGIKFAYKYQSNNHIFFKAGLNLFKKLKVIEDDFKPSYFKGLSLVGNFLNLSLGYSF